MNPWFYVTVLGDSWVWIIVLAVLVLFYILYRKKLEIRKRRGFKGFLILAILSITISIAVVFALKMSFNVQRPCTPCLEGIADCNPYCNADSSFPSGHTTVAFAGFGSIYIALRKKWVWILPSIVAASRLLLGVHTAQDVVAGGVLGLIILCLIYKLIETKKWI